ncbi:MAG: anti-sigma factor domain-containing protein [Actinomycetota bacterium]
MTHEEVEELLPAFALDAVSPAEEMELRLHIEDCRRCGALAMEYRQTADSLALLAPTLQPPPALCGRLLREVSTAGQARAPTRKRRQRLPWERIGAALTTAALLLLAVLSVALQHMLLQERRDSAEQLQALSVVGSPSGTSAPMEATRHAPGAAGQIYIDDRSQSVAVVMRGLPDPGVKVYQLWLLRDGRVLPVRSFRPNATGAATVFLESAAAAGRGITVSLEPSMGSRSPRGPRVLRSG